MAVVVNSDASTFKRTANLPAGTACTMWGWFRATTDRNTFTGFLAINSAVDALNWVSIGTTSDGTTVELTDGNGSGSSLSASMLGISLNTWYFFAFTTSGTAANATSAYWRTLTSNALSSATITGASSRSTTVGAMEFGRDGFTGEYLNGEMHAIGCTDAVLSADELLELSYFHEPQLDGIRSLNVFYPTIESVNTNASIDRSGNGRNATATVGSLVDSPPLLWRAPPPIVPMAASGGSTQYNQSVSGSLTSAGAAVKQTGKIVSAAISSSGALLKQARRSLTGAISTAGTLASVKAALLSIAGTLTSGGALTKRIGKIQSGSLTSSGSISKRTSRALIASMTSSASLAAIKTALLSIAGALTSAGALTKRAGKVSVGSVPSMGVLAKQARRALSSAIASSAVLSAIKTALLTLSGSLASSGSLNRRVGKALEGSLQPIGALVKRIARAIAGSLASAGALLAGTASQIPEPPQSRSIIVRSFERIVRLGKSSRNISVNRK